MPNLEDDEAGEAVQQQISQENQAQAEDEQEALLDKVPPDFDLAKMHGEANRVKDFTNPKGGSDDFNEEGARCPCCDMPTFKAFPQYPMCTAAKKLDALGSGLPLFYNFKKYVLYIFIMMAVLYGIAAIIVNFMAGNAK